MSKQGAVIAEDLIWAIGITVYMIIYARMGTDVAASMSIVNIVKQLAIVLFIGIANACLIYNIKSFFCYRLYHISRALILQIALPCLLIFLNITAQNPYRAKRDEKLSINNCLTECEVVFNKNI